MQLQIIAKMISDVMEFSREDTISEIINMQDDTEPNEIENSGVNKSYITTVLTGEKENSRQVLEIDSNLVESSDINIISTDILIPGIESKTKEPSYLSHVTDVHDQDDNLPNEKEKNMNANCAVDKSQLPPDVVRVLKNMLDNKVVSVSSDKTQPTKHKIIVAKVPTNTLKQMIATKYEGTQINEIENCSFQNNCIAKLPTNLAEALKNIFVQKASGQIKINSTKKDQQFVEKVLSDIPSVLNKTYTEKIRTDTSCQQSNSKFEVVTLHCPSKLSISKYLYDWMLRTRELEYLEKSCYLDFGEHILLSSKKCLILTLPYSPGFEDERATNTQIIAEEYGTMSSFEFNENCTLEKEFNKIFHYFSCPNLSNTATRETVLQYVFQSMRELMAHLPVQDALKLTCNCSLCWFLYVRGKIFNSYYPEENLNYGHSPLASYRTLAVRNIEITDLNPKPDSQCLLQEDEGHYFLPIRFKRGGKKRDLTKRTSLYSSFNPYLNGNVSLKRSKEAEINLELSKLYKSPTTYQDNDYSRIVNNDTEDNDKQLNQLEIATAKSIEAVTSNKLAVANAAMSIYVPIVGYSSPNSSAENEKNGINSESSVMFTEMSDETSNSKPLTVCLASTYNNSPSKFMFSLKSYAAAAHKSTEQPKRTDITSTSEILSAENENILDNSTLISSPVSCDLDEVKPSEHSKKAIFKCGTVNKKFDSLNSNRLKGELMAAKKYSQISKQSQKQGSSNRIDFFTKPNKNEYLNPKKTGGITKIKNDLVTHKSDVGLSNQFEGEVSISNILPVTVVPSSNVNCKSDFPVSSNTASTNINDKTETSHCQDLKESVTVMPNNGFKHKLASTPNKFNEQIESLDIQKPIDFYKFVSPVAESSISSVKCELQSLVSSDLTSGKLKKQTETTYVQESKECIDSNSSETELPSTGIKRKSESPVPCYSTSKKYKRIGTSQIQESEDCLSSVSLVTESSNSETEYKEDFSVSIDPTSAEIKKQAKTSDIEVSKELLKSVASFKNSPNMEVKCELYSSVSETKKQTVSETLNVHKFKKLSEKTVETVETKPVSSGINIVKLPSSSNLFGALQNLGVSGAMNVVNLPSESISGILKTLGVSNPAPTVSIVKVPRSSLPDSLQTLTAPSSNSGALNVINVSASTSAKLIPELAAPLQTLKIQSPCSGTIRVLQVSNKNASEFKLPSLIQVSNTNVNVMQHPIPLSNFFDVSSDNSDAVSVQDSSVDPSNQKTSEISNSIIPVSVSENNKKDIDSIQKHDDVYNVVTYNDGTMNIGGFRGFKILD